MNVRIPLERGRDIALQYGVAPLLAPLFDFVPNANPMGGLPTSLSSVPGMQFLVRSLHYLIQTCSGLAPPPIMPGSALRLLNQGRAQGLFTPSTSSMSTAHPTSNAPPGPHFVAGYPSGFPSIGAASPTPPPLAQSSLKRTHSQIDLDSHPMPPNSTSQTAPPALAASPDIQMLDRSRPASTVSQDGGPSPSKRARTEPPGLPDGMGRESPAMNASTRDK